MKKRPRTCGNAVRGFFLGICGKATCPQSAPNLPHARGYRWAAAQFAAQIPRFWALRKCRFCDGFLGRLCAAFARTRRSARGRASTCYPCVAMHSLATAMKHTERISSATAWRSVAMPAWNGLARARRRFWVGLRALLWCIGIRALAHPRHWGRSAVRSGALFASCSLLFPHAARARVKAIRRVSPCARLGVVGVGG